VKTGFLPVIGLRDVMYHMAVSSPKQQRSETYLRNYYIHRLGLREVTARV